VNIVAICDVYVALIHKRPYKQAWTKDEALNFIATQSGKQFSPILAHIFIKLMREQDSR
jgi:putative two-component system response regulator